MKDFLKSKVVTIVILLATLILAGIAIFTAVRLYQLRQQAVAPTAPESKPQAAGQGCSALTFSLTINCNETCGGLTGTICPTDLVCIYSNGTTTAPNPDAQGNCRNPDCNTETDCVCGTGTPTATPTATPTGSPTSTPTPSGTPNSCNGTCGSDSNCSSGLICSGGFCRNSSCTSETDCTCPTTTPTSTATGTPTGTSTPAPSLPTAGTNWPTIVGLGIGTLLLVGALLLAL